eukprot:COSAG04_NODE_10979_length_739_cov_2.093750_2_plen_107_part_00
MLPSFTGSAIFGGFAENDWHLDSDNEAPSDTEIDAQIASYGDTRQLISDTFANISPGHAIHSRVHQQNKTSSSLCCVLSVAEQTKMLRTTSVGFLVSAHTRFAVSH